MGAGLNADPVAHDGREPDVLVFVHGRCSPSALQAGLEALRKTSKTGLRVAIVDDADGGCELVQLESPDMVFLRRSAPASHAIDVIRGALTSAPGADLVVLRAGAVLGEGWYETLRAVAYGDSTTVTASAIHGHPGPLRRSAGADGGNEPTSAPATPAPHWGCALVRRDAIEAALALHAEAVPQGASLTLALETLVVAPGFVHRLAPVAVSGAWQGSTRERMSSGERHLLDLADSDRGALRVMIDLRCCAFPMSGTQVQALELVRALSKVAGVEVAVLLPKVVAPSVSSDVIQLPTSIRRHTTKNLPRRRPHIFHCPYQLLADQHLGEALTLGDRLVITQQDMIMNHTPSYFRSREDWRRFIDATDTSFLVADHVAFFSPHAMGDALREGVLASERASVVPIGTDHVSGAEEGAIDNQAALRLEAANEQFVLVLGNAYLHKNRVHALKILTSLRRTEGWGGKLVLAGGHPPIGGSAAIEQAYLQAHKDDAEFVLELGPVSDGLKTWLYGHASMVLYPTLYEGFGLVPFEAAAFGTPVAYARRSALADFLPAEGALLDGWNADAAAERIGEVLSDPSAANEIVAAVREAGRGLTWERTAESYVEIYRRILTTRPRFSLALGGLAIGPSVSTLAPAEQQMLTAYRRSRAMRLGVEVLMSTAVAGKTWIRSARASAKAPSRGGKYPHPG